MFHPKTLTAASASNAAHTFLTSAASNFVKAAALVCHFHLPNDIASYTAVLPGRWKEGAEALRDLDSHGMSSLLALQGYIHRLSWEQQPCQDWWHPFQMGSLEWYHYQMAIQPWKQFTPMALFPTQVRRAGK